MGGLGTGAGSGRELGCIQHNVALSLQAELTLMVMELAKAPGQDLFE